MRSKNCVSFCCRVCGFRNHFVPKTVFRVDKQGVVVRFVKFKCKKCLSEGCFRFRK